MKILDANAAVDREWEKVKSLPELQEQKVKSKKEVIEQAQKSMRISSFCVAHGLMPLEETGTRTKVPEIQTVVSY